MAALLALFLALLLAYVFSEVAALFKLPRVIGQIISGLALAGLFAAGVAFDPQTSSLLEILADIGIILLFFFVGLEINLGIFKKTLKQSLSISLFNTLIPLVVGFTAAKLFGFEDIAAVVVGLALSVSSQAVAMDFLDEFNLLKTKLGQTIVAAGAVDDVVEFLLISLLLAGIHFSAQTALGTAAVQIIAFIFILALLRFAVLPILMKFFETQEKRSSLLTGALIVTLFLAIISDYFGLGTIIGAFVAGVMVRQILVTDNRKPWEEHKLAHEIHSLSFGFLVPVFFVWVGLNTNLTAVFASPVISFTFLAIALVGTIAGTLIAMRLNGHTVQEGLIVGLGVTAKGDVELAIAALALKQAVISPEIFSALVFMSVATTIIAPIAFRQFALSYFSKPQVAKGQKRK